MTNRVKPNFRPSVLDPRVSMAQLIYPRLQKFIKMESEWGKLLPKDYASDPGGWLEALRAMELAFFIFLDKEQPWSQEQEDDMQKGFVLFGKYFLDIYENAV